MKYINLLLVLFVFSTLRLWAQEENSYNAEDTTYEFKDYDDLSLPFYFNMHKNPVVEFSYGLPKFENRDIRGAFAKSGFAEVRVGYWKIYNMHTSIIKQRNSFVYVSGITNDLASKSKENVDYAPEIWRIGLGQIYGFGYKIGASSISFYSSNSVGWSHFKTGRYENTSPAEDIDLLDHYANTVRFGTSSEGGTVFRLGSFLSLKAGYERSIIFPGYVFWEHMGSMTIEYCGLALIDRFVIDVNRSSPYMTPVIDFLLKNAFSYGLYSLRNEKMNWPFNGASPLAINTFKFSLTVLL